MARKTPVTTVPKDSGASHAGEFTAAVNKIRGPGEVSDRTAVSPAGVKDWQVDPTSKYEDVRPE